MHFPVFDSGPSSRPQKWLMLADWDARHGSRVGLPGEHKLSSVTSLSWMQGARQGSKGRPSFSQASGLVSGEVEGAWVNMCVCVRGSQDLMGFADVCCPETHSSGALSSLLPALNRWHKHCWVEKNDRALTFFFFFFFLLLIPLHSPTLCRPRVYEPSCHLDRLLESLSKRWCCRVFVLPV